MVIFPQPAGDRREENQRAVGARRAQRRFLARHQDRHIVGREIAHRLGLAPRRRIAFRRTAPAAGTKTGQERRAPLRRPSHGERVRRAQTGQYPLPHAQGEEDLTCTLPHYFGVITSIDQLIMTTVDHLIVAS